MMLILFLIILSFYSSLSTITIIKDESVVRRIYELSYSTTKEPQPYIKGTIRYLSDECFQIPPPSNYSNYEHNYAFILFEKSVKCTMQTQFVNALRAGYQVVVFIEPSVPPRFSRPVDYNDLAIVLLLSESDFNVMMEYDYDASHAIAIYHPNPIPYVYHILPLVMVGAGIILIFLSLSGYYGYRIILKKYHQYKISRRILYLPSRTSIQSDEEEQCPICWDNYKINDIITVLLCKHEYHRECLRKWKGDECPLCRSKIYVTEIDQSRLDIRSRSLLRDESSDDEEAELLPNTENPNEGFSDVSEAGTSDSVSHMI